MACESLGKSGQPIVLLHGWGQSKADLRPLGQLLTKMGQVHLIDLPGFGDSPIPDTPWSTADYAASLADHLEASQIYRPVLLGHSFGGRVAIQFARLFPNRARGLVLLAAAGLRRHRSFPERIRFKMIQFLGKFLKRTQSMTSLPTYEWFISRFSSRDYKNAGDLREIFIRTINEDLSEAAKMIECPSLLIWGDKDSETPLEIGMRYQRLIQRSNLIVLPNKDHFPHRGAGAHLCAYHILQWLSSLP